MGCLSIPVILSSINLLNWRWLQACADVTRARAHTLRIYLVHMIRKVVIENCLLGQMLDHDRRGLWVTTIALLSRHLAKLRATSPLDGALILSFLGSCRGIHWTVFLIKAIAFGQRTIALLRLRRTKLCFKQVEAATVCGRLIDISAVIWGRELLLNLQLEQVTVLFINRWGAEIRHETFVLMRVWNDHNWITLFLHLLLLWGEN